MAADPSLRGEELGAVTVPVPGMKAGLIAFSLSGLSCFELGLVSSDAQISQGKWVWR